MQNNNITQYFSKWRECWVFFTTTMGYRYNPTDWEVEQMKKLKYKLK